MAVILNAPADNHGLDGIMSSLKVAVYGSMALTALAVIAPIGFVYVIYRNWK